ncbi:hypothetical protein [Mucilaginibacter sp.]|uniref:hypothetical protein n=1 Tax=Mucilaginibacter sp. TaxID=1882438 RepID=UPI0026100F20|nr:hypothetical protein [Mucilaginibacter sp.]MDB4926770.1 hypothetical protein [Mucilaginibacter sp.]
MITAVNTSPFHLSMARRFNVWYSVKDGNWDDSTVWRSNGSKRHSLPQPGDDVYIGHVVAWNYNSPGNIYNNTIRNLYIFNKLICNPSLNQTNLIVNNVFCSGTLDLSGSNGGGGFRLNINGDKSFFNNFVQGNSTSSITVVYDSPNSFAIPDIPYYNLNVRGAGTKWITNNLTIPGALTLGSASVTFELGNYDLNVFNYANDGVSNCTLSKTGSGTVSFTGPNHSMSGNISFTGNPTINLSGSFNGLSRATGVFNFGTGTLNVLQNSTWTFSSGGNVPFSLSTGLNVLIAAGKTLTYSGIAPWQNNGTVNGIDGASTLNISTGYCYGNLNTVMATGVFNYNFSGTSTILYRVSTTLPNTSYYGLVIDSGITIDLLGSTSVNNLTVNNSTLRLGNYDFSVTAATTLLGSITKTGSGNVSFSSLILNNATSIIDFTGGNPIVNISGNISGDPRSGINFGNNIINILQSINIALDSGASQPWNCGTNILIAAGKTLTNTGSGSTTGGIDFTGTLNGASSTSKLDNRSICNYRNAQQPMQTGVLDCNAGLNTFRYNLSGNQDVTPGIYRNLTLVGSGAKKILGNVSVINTYTLTAPTTLDSNGFALTNP